MLLVSGQPRTHRAAIIITPYIGRTKNVEEDREKLAENRKYLVLREVRFDEFSEDLHGAMYGVGREGRKEANQ